jgi:hypothetical protein
VQVVDERKTPTPRALGWIAGLAVAGFLVVGVSAALVQMRDRTNRSVEIQDAKQLNLALIKFDDEYGSFPSDETAGDNPAFVGLTGPRVLEQLEAAGFVDDLDELLGVSDDPKAKWYYFPGVSTSGDPVRPVLIYPAINDKVMVLRIDGSAKPEYASSLSRMDLTGAVEMPALRKKR